MAQVATFEELSLEGLKALYDAEKQAVAAYPALIDAVTSADLKEAFQEHLEQTKNQVNRLELAFQKMGESPAALHNDAVAGCIKDATDMIRNIERGAVLDAALIAAAQKVEHLEIAGYGTARTFAEQMGSDAVAQLLEETLEEEEETDDRLSDLAETVINERAASRG